MLQQQGYPKTRNLKEYVFEKDTDRCLAIIGLHGQPTLEQIKKAYKVLIKQWHPDLFHDRPEMEMVAVQKTQTINLAYRYLLEKYALNGQPDIGSEAHKKHNYSWQKYSDGFPDPSIIEFFLNSSHIVSAGYSKQRRILYLKFLGDEIYLYFEVPEFIMDHLLKAHSPGKYAIRFIYDRFRHRKFTPITKNFRLDV